MWSRAGLCLLFCLGALASEAGAQDVKVAQNGDKPVKKSETVKVDSTSGEMDLGEIAIQGRVEKPGVVLIPKRIEAKVEEKSLERSFTQELKSGGNGIVQPKSALSEVEQVKSIKSAVRRDRKKEEKKKNNS